MQTDSLQSPLPTATPTPQAGECGRGEGETEVWMGKEIQLNYHCFNIQISFISLMLARTKFISLLGTQRGQRGQGAGGLGGAGRSAPPPPAFSSGLIFSQQHHSPTSSHRASISL